MTKLAQPTASSNNTTAQTAMIRCTPRPRRKPAAINRYISHKYPPHEHKLCSTPVPPSNVVIELQHQSPPDACSLPAPALPLPCLPPSRTPSRLNQSLYRQQLPQLACGRRRVAALPKFRVPGVYVDVGVVVVVAVVSLVVLPRLPDSCGRLRGDA